MIYKSGFKSLSVTYDFDLNQSSGHDLSFWFKPLLYDFDLSLFVEVKNIILELLKFN